MASTRVRRHLAASPARVYAALVDPALVSQWRVPSAMSCVVHVFETADDPVLQGESRSTIGLLPVAGGTELVAVHENLPPGLDPTANEAGWNEALDRLGALVEES